MGSLVIYDKNGEPLQARATLVKATQSCALCAEDVINFEVGSNEVVPFTIGDYINYCGKTYTLNRLPKVQKNNATDFHYTGQFESEQYELLDSAWMLPPDTYGDSFTGNLHDFLQILIQNTDRSGKSWILGDYPTETNEEYKTLSYTGDTANCLYVLQQLCKEWAVEFEIARQNAVRVLNIKKTVGEKFFFKFEYGRKGGAYRIERNPATNKNVITRLFCFGSDKNLPSDYRENKLCLPGKARNESYITSDEAVRLYGFREALKKFDDICPARYGKVTAVDSSNKNIFYDNTMDFDLNEKNEYGTKWLIPSTVAKIQFNSGGLAGYSFDLVAYDHALKQFRIKTYTDNNGLQFPNENSAAFQIREGDEYFITDIKVPDAYIAAAEEKLLSEGQKYFDENCKTYVTYTLQLSPLFLQKLYNNSKLETKIFAAGDFIEIFDHDLEIQKTLRISSFTRNLLNPYEFNITIAENVELQSTFQQIVSELADIRHTVYMNDQTAADNARRNWLATQEVLNSVFDPEGNYYSEKIKPLSIETTMLAVGARSQQFVLKDVLFETNYTADPNSVHNTAGTLEHYTIAEPETRTWQITDGTAANLDPTKVYYIYAKCPRNGEIGTILYDTAQHTVEGEPQFFYFLIGTITTPITDSNGERPARAVALTYGSSTINGRFIRTGRIQSQDGSVYIDLDKNEIAGRFNFQDGLISNVIGIGKDGLTAAAGLGGINRHPQDGSIPNFDAEGAEYVPTKNGIRTALWANRTYPSMQGLDIVTADTVILQDGTIRIRNHGVGGRLLFYADPARDYINITETVIGRIRTADRAFIEKSKANYHIADISAYTPFLYADNLIQQFEYRGEKIKAFTPSLVWGGQVFRTQNGYDVSAYSSNFPITVTATREDVGIVTLHLSKDLPAIGTFITAQGWGTNNGTAFVTIKAKAPHLGYITVKISDDSSTNDYDFEIQIWHVQMPSQSKMPGVFDAEKNEWIR